MRGSGSLVLVLFSASAAVAISNDNIQRDIKTPNIRTPHQQYQDNVQRDIKTPITRTQSQQHDIQLPHHLRTNNNRRNLRSDDKSTIEFCGKCTWQGNISCEARAQYLVRNSSPESNLTLKDARISISETCKSDGSDLSSIPLDAFCGTCQYMKMNFNCNSRVDYLVTTYYLGREKAIESLLKDGHCIDVNWVPPNNTINEDDNTSDSLSNGAIIGIVIGITILLCCCIGLGSLYYYKRTNQKLDEQTQASNQPAGSKRAKASEIRKKVMAEANARNNTDSPDSSSREEQDIKKKKKSLSFAPPVVWNITSDDGDKPDPPTQDEVINKEKELNKDGDVSSSTQQVLDMMESALNTTKTNNSDDPPELFRDSTISELSCNIDPPTDDEEEGIVLPSTMDEEQALPDSSGQIVVNEKQDALAIDNDSKQNEEGIVRRISLEP